MFTYTRYLPLESCTSHMPLEPLSLPMFCSYKSPSLGKEVILESNQQSFSCMNQFMDYTEKQCLQSDLWSQAMTVWMLTLHLTVIAWLQRWVSCIPFTEPPFVILNHKGSFSYLIWHFCLTFLVTSFLFLTIVQPLKELHHWNIHHNLNPFNFSTISIH